jgi:hypothetical protein
MGRAESNRQEPLVAPTARRPTADSAGSESRHPIHDLTPSAPPPFSRPPAREEVPVYSPFTSASLRAWPKGRLSELPLAGDHGHEHTVEDFHEA